VDSAPALSKRSAMSTALPSMQPMTPARPPSAFGCRAPGVDVGRCRRRLEDAYGIEFCEVLYRWHPWFGLRVAVHEAISHPHGVVLRCTLSGVGGDRRLELPAWMFDRAACRDVFPLTTTPHVAKAALCALADLLRDELKRSALAATASVCGASCASRNEDVGGPVLASTTERRAKAFKDRRSRPRQFDLFAEIVSKSAADMPAWSVPQSR